MKAGTLTREDQGPRRQRRRGRVTPLGRGHQGGGEGWWVEDDDIPGVGISIAGGVEGMVCSCNHCDFFLFYFLISIIYCFYWGKHTTVLIPRC